MRRPRGGDRVGLLDVRDGDLAWRRELAARDAETLVAVPIGVRFFQLAGSNHHRALEFGAAVDTAVIVARFGACLRGRELGRELLEQLASAGGSTMLALALTSGVAPALCPQVRARALVPQPLAQAELLEERRGEVADRGEATVARPLLVDLQFALRPALDQARLTRSATRARRAARAGRPVRRGREG